MIKILFKGSLTIPNLLCVIRIILVPVFAVLFLQDHKVAAVIVLAISGLTDFFDGKIARRFNQVSELGKILDPVADKLTQLTIAVILLIKFLEPDRSPMIRAFGWVFVVFLAKEAVMVIGGLCMLLFGIKPGAAEMPGKVATMVFYISMILIVAFGNGIGVFTFWVMPDILAGILVCISAICTLVAFCSYMPETHRQVQHRFSPEGKAERKAQKEADKAKAKEAQFDE